MSEGQVVFPDSQCEVDGFSNGIAILKKCILACDFDLLRFIHLHIATLHNKDAIRVSDKEACGVV
jgi:hypothetical protein